MTPPQGVHRIDHAELHGSRIHPVDPVDLRSCLGVPVPTFSMGMAQAAKANVPANKVSVARFII